MSDLIGHVFANRYRIDEAIGHGAMGVVYRARHVKLARSFAVKILHPQLLTNEKVRKRFEREAQVAATLRHDNVIGVVDVGEMDGLRYLVMDFAEGQTLSTLIAQGPMASPRVLKIAQQLCDGLQHAHDSGLIHRDFKPDNVIVQRDADGTETPRIVDFGIALLRDDASPTDRERLTTAGIVLGTPHYMAPEHASGKPVDHRIDLFALGLTIFEMLTGRLPFEGDGVDVARSNIMFDTPSMKALVPELDVDPLLEAFTRKLTARSLDERLPSARAARELLDLIERDRERARAELGLAPVPAPVAATPRPMLAMPIVTLNRTRAASTLPPDSATSTIVEQQIETTKTRIAKKPLPWRYVAAACSVMIVMGIGAFAMRRDLAKPETTAKVVEAVKPPPPAPAVMPQPPPPVVVEPVVVDVQPKRITVKPVTKPAPPPVAQAVPPTTNPLPSTTPSAAELAKYYAAIGRKLGYLEKHYGQPVTLELWPRYRHVRIQSALATQESRAAAAATLRLLEQEIDAAMRGGQ